MCPWRSTTTKLLRLTASFDVERLRRRVRIRFNYSYRDAEWSRPELRHALPVRVIFVAGPQIDATITSTVNALLRVYPTRASPSTQGAEPRRRRRVHSRRVRDSLRLGVDMCIASTSAKSRATLLRASKPHSVRC